MELRSRPSREHAADVDQVVGQDAQADPAFHAGVTLVATPGQAMAPLHHADATFTPGPPSLAVLEPALLLFSLARGALGGPIGNTDPGHALGVRGVFIGARVERGVGGDEARHVSKHLRVCVNRRQEQLGVAGPRS